jgi:acyl phosphate:glycerol-3-phosphate acyltransferase
LKNSFKDLEINLHTVTGYLIVILVAYCVGSFPSGYVFARLWGRDIRQSGSGRTGMTNVLRSVGVVPALLTIVSDTTKGMIAVGIATAVVGTPAAQALAGLAAVIGHDYSLFLKGGGRGVATSLAALASFALAPAAVVWGAFLVVLVLSEYASLASLSSALLMPIALAAWILFDHGSPWYIVYGIGACALIFFLHRDNIERLRLGRERKVGDKALAAESSG